MTVAVLILTILITLGAAASAQTTSILLCVELPDSPTAGARVFAQKSCIRCHSLGGGSETRLGPDLGRVVFTGTVLDLAGAFWNHSPVMREKMEELKIQPPALSRSDMAELLAFLTMYRYYVTEVGAPGDPAVGQMVFTSKGCAGCHGEEGNRWDKPGPGLRRYRGRFSAIFLAQAMWNHAPEMASVMRTRSVPWPRFVGHEMSDLIAYLQTSGAGSGVEPVYFQPGNPARGRDLFSGKRCSACHAIAGRGGRGAPDLGTRGGELMRSVSEVAGLMWNHSQRMAAEFRRRRIPPVLFSGQEMADVIAYLYFVNYANVRGTPARGQQLFVAKCSTCHSIGGGRKVGPDLGAVPRLDDPIAIIAAMWNHAPTMERELRKRGLKWPRFEQGEPADLTAFLLTQRTVAAEPRPARK